MVETADQARAIVEAVRYGPGDLSQSMGYLPSVPLGEERPAPVQEAMADAVRRIRAAGKIAGTLVFEHEVKRWATAGVQFFFIHSDPFLRTGLVRMRKLATT